MNNGSLTRTSGEVTVIMSRIITGIPRNDWFIIRAYEPFVITKVRGVTGKHCMEDGTILEDIGSVDEGRAKTVIDKAFPEFIDRHMQMGGYKEITLKDHYSRLETPTLDL